MLEERERNYVNEMTLQDILSRNYEAKFMTAILQIRCQPTGTMIFKNERNALSDY